MMITRRSIISRPTTRLLARFQSSLSKESTSTPDAKDSTRLQQAPNRETTWSRSQASRTEVLNHAKFIQKDLSKQPQPYAAIDLIAKQPVRYIPDRIATCAGNKQLGQGHPKIYINLDPKRPATCGYCGLRFAQEEYREEIEASDAH
ncbi:NADH dehydrogenase [ubiquinone] iron-sulfur protein 6, mitochondrial [Wickerhamomyces ciferrii]|uniref:NADH dehydrogenase [ubiquinone] iron-sulfur protein 6, mitochondrial n=1 Tax=Wickerhamomyces ciferrii (strain ATCC 14091 / BCRC 22168 / CBS 111 / JCM 3599 / NBRC 0793 / NRRL Y-1031 F-60-10) TaxID=1206466 RepID=K0KK92_WICCF|nr:NADH dehydrogenase [ubiquinone] iron-sulfur protein 6, mitochondrial [Wickerhamomyces ciferrii]CCH43356.1 NADH dehydrogenase [ubiquinone] iron-sulfur protein 6, mitochondrial [Wickerhamomyces ciferrii]